MRRLIAVLALLAFVAAACGSDRDDDPTAGQGDNADQSESDSGGGGSDQFGDLDTPCGPAEDGEEASGSGNEQGVTADQVVIGYGDDAGFPQSPGLNHEMSDAVKAFIGWCNEQGGINGREIVGNYYDAKITEVTNAITQACDEVFMLVGEGWALDSAQEETRLGCDLPMVPTYTVSAEAANAPLKYQAVPNPIDLSATGGAALLAELFPDEARSAGQAYPHLQNLLDAAAQEGYEPIWLTGSNSYLASFAEWNASGNGDNVYVATAFTPFEQADDNPATQQYIDIVEADGGDISQLGQQAASSFLLWATAALRRGAHP